MTMTMIGGEVCKQRLASQLLPAEPRGLTRAEIDGLWALQSYRPTLATRPKCR